MPNRIAVVNGATSGIGRACVVDFAKNGVNDMFLKSVWRCMNREIEYMLPNRSGVRHGVAGSTKAATAQYEGEGLSLSCYAAKEGGE